MEEKLIWRGNPSQWTNFSTFAVCTLLCWLVIPLFIMLWKYLQVRCWTFVITDQRITERKGILTRSIDHTELFRVRDARLTQPLLLRAVGLYNLVLVTNDKSDPIIVIPAIRNGEELERQIRDASLRRRSDRRIFEVDQNY